MQNPAPYAVVRRSVRYRSQPTRPGGNRRTAGGNRRTAGVSRRTPGGGQRVAGGDHSPPSLPAGSPELSSSTTGSGSTGFSFTGGTGWVQTAGMKSIEAVER